MSGAVVGVGCCEMRVDVKKMMGGGYGGVNGHYCGPIGHWILRIE